jgi:biotin carboxyl carrier protein
MMQKFVFEGQDVEIESQVVAGKTWVHFRGQNICLDEVLESGSAQRRKKTKSSNQTGAILSPMPGKISKVLVKENDHVKAGQVLVVMEAMKMEYTLKADLDGIVAKVFTKALDLVPLGHLLVQIQGRQP